MESTLNKDCIHWSMIEATSKRPGFYELKCNESCAKYSNKYNTCIDYALKEIQIQKLLKE